MRTPSLENKSCDAPVQGIITSCTGAEGVARSHDLNRHHRRNFVRNKSNLQLRYVSDERANNIYYYEQFIISQCAIHVFMIQISLIKII